MATANRLSKPAEGGEEFIGPLGGLGGGKASDIWPGRKINWGGSSPSLPAFMPRRR